MSKIDTFLPASCPTWVQIAGQLEVREPERINREWERLCALNPRLHDGPVLHVQGFSLVTGKITCLRSTYKIFVAGPIVGTRVRTLGVTGICVRQGPTGEEVLVGRRGENVRIYGGMWETAPRGSVEAPAGVTEMGLERIAACLARESHEELGAPLKVSACIGVVHDRNASSVDICLRCELGERVGEGSWEYSATSWMNVDVLKRWAHREIPPGREGQTLSPPCAAWFRSRSVV